MNEIIVLAVLLTAVLESSILAALYVKGHKDSWLSFLLILGNVVVYIGVLFVVCYFVWTTTRQPVVVSI